MRKMNLVLALACLCVAAGCATTVSVQGDGCPCTQCDQAACEEPCKLLRHVVLFKFKDEATPEDVKSVEDAFRALPEKIDTIGDFEWGTDVSVENLAQGFTHCFFVTFKTEEDRAAYLPHPAHKEFGKILGPHLDKVLVVDYWTKK